MAVNYRARGAKRASGANAPGGRPAVAGNSSGADAPGERAAVFLDKDGTLIENVPYNVDPQRVRLVPGSGEALASLAQAGFALIVVTNQSGVARGYFSESALAAVEARIGELLEPYGVALAGFYACPHHPEGIVAEYSRDCDCRKPRPGLLQQAAGHLAISLDRSWMVGDILDDVEAGCRAGCRTVLIDNGGETEWLSGECRRPDLMTGSLREAARGILAAGAPTGLERTSREGEECDAIYSI